MIQMLPLRTGWDPTLDGEDDYPPDLPPEWRLAYFAGLFRGVLVPAGLWREAGTAGAAAWVADTPARFRFFLELEEGDAARWPDPVVEALGDRLGGLVGPASAPASDLVAAPHPGVDPGAAPPRLLRVVAAARGCADTPPGVGLAWEVPDPLLSDLRGARIWVEARVRSEGPQGVRGAAVFGTPQPVIALLGDCRFEDLARWQTMLELMGLA
jgi:hypothetical protein